MPRIESRIRDVAQAQGITTISALARKAGLDRGTVRRLWGREMPAWVKFSTITKICHALGDARIDAVIVFIAQDT